MLVSKKGSNLVGKEDNIWFRFKESKYIGNGGYGIYICQVENGPLKGHDVPIVGMLPYPPIEGQIIHLYGKWEMHEKYGLQFRIKKYLLDTNTEIYYFLSRMVDGVGPKLSRQIFDHFKGEKLDEIIEKNPNRLLEVSGIGRKKLNHILELWNMYKDRLDLISLFLSNGLTVSMAMKVYEQYKSRAMETVLRNPYVLIDMLGVDFKKVDAIAMHIGIGPTDTRRIVEAIKYVLNFAANRGHVFMPFAGVKGYVCKHLGIDENVFDQKWEDVKTLAIKREWLHIDENNLYLKPNYIAERGLADFFTQNPYTEPILGNSALESFLREEQEKLGIRLDEIQRSAVWLANRSRCFVLLGYAGTGKTTVSRVILDLYAQKYRRTAIVGCAFTGIAAERLRNKTGYKSMTIHSLLGWNGVSFAYSRANPLPYDVVLLDEASMVESDLFYRLVTALRPDSRFIVVGDPAQLPAIGPGDVLYQLSQVDSIPKVELTRVFRQSDKSVLKFFASCVRKGEIPDGLMNKDYIDFAFIERNTDKEIRDTIKQLVENNAGLGDYTQLLSAVKKHELGSISLNLMVQKILNGDKVEQGVEVAGKFKVGDRVVHLENRDMASYEMTPDGNLKRIGTVRVLNGMIGYVVKIMRYLIVVRYSVSDKEFLIVYNPDEHGFIDLAYCLTVHKSQGAEYPFVLMPLTMSHRVMYNSQILYTAMTRASQKIVFVGQREAFEFAVCTRGRVHRNTRLGDLIREKSSKG